MLKRHELVFILLTVGFVFFTLGFFVGKAQIGDTFRISPARTAPSPQPQVSATPTDVPSEIAAPSPIPSETPEVSAPPAQSESPKPSEQPKPSAAAPTSPYVNINTADLKELTRLPGVGEAIAQRIIDWRNENGDFMVVEDLLYVKGIGEKTLEKMRSMVVLR